MKFFYVFILRPRVVTSIILYFNHFDLKLILRYDGINIVTAPSSNFPHWYSSLGRYQNTPMAIGGQLHYGDNTVESLSGGYWNMEPQIPR